MVLRMHKCRKIRKAMLVIGVVFCGGWAPKDYRLIRLVSFGVELSQNPRTYTCMHVKFRNDSPSKPDQSNLTLFTVRTLTRHELRYKRLDV